MEDGYVVTFGDPNIHASIPYINRLIYYIYYIYYVYVGGGRVRRDIWGGVHLGPVVSGSAGATVSAGDEGAQGVGSSDGASRPRPARRCRWYTYIYIHNIYIYICIYTCIGICICICICT